MELPVSRSMLAVRTVSRGRLDRLGLGRAAREALAETVSAFRLPAAGVEVLRVGRRRGAEEARDRARAALREERDVEFAGRILRHPVSGLPALYTENVFIRFRPDRAASRCRRDLERHGLLVKREIPWLANAWFAQVPDGAGLEVFAAAERALADGEVVACHPEVIWEGSRRQDPFPLQWHLGRRTIGGVEVDAHAAVEEAWELTRGERTVVAVIDDGVDLGHEELRSPGKIVAPRDATEKTDDPRPAGDDAHGTASAGIVCADGVAGASGVAPAARLLPVRLVSGLGSQDEADAIQWAAEQGADVISCAWGPGDGDWRDPDDPAHHAAHPLPDSTRAAIDWATEHGRGGRGCVICWAAGNGAESVDLDGYAANPSVIAVAACNDDGRHSPYSDAGDAVWCCFPSNDFDSPRTTGIWTCDRTGRAGYNPGRSKLGDREGRYTNRFQGTSAACPGAAGVAALVLSAAPELGWREVKALLAATADRIDTERGGYDAAGHSPLYGHGRLNARRAVAAARGLGGVAAAAAGEPEAPPSSPAPAPRRRLEVALATPAPEARLFLDGTPLELAAGPAAVPVAAGETYVLTWWIAGPPGTPFRIAATADGRVGGHLPVVGRIPRTGKTGGSRRLRVAARPSPTPPKGDPT